MVTQADHPTELDPLLGALLALHAYVREGCPQTGTTHDLTIFFFEMAAAHVAVQWAHVPITEEAWSCYLHLQTASLGETFAEPAFFEIACLERTLVSCFVPNARHDELGRELLRKAVRQLHQRQAVEVWPSIDAPTHFRATVRLAAAHPRLPPLPASQRPPDIPVAPDEHASHASSRNLEADLLNAAEQAVVTLLRDAKGHFVTAPLIEQAHGTRTSARALLLRIRAKCPHLRIESAREAQARNDPSATDHKGYRLLPDATPPLAPSLPPPTAS